nr:metallothionein-like protein 3A [Malus domestica]
MSGKCDNCDCADSTQCVKKGNSYDLVIVETENRSMDRLRGCSCRRARRKVQVRHRLLMCELHLWSLNPYNQIKDVNE